RFLLLGLGRLMHQKGFDLLVEAFGELAAEHPRWDLRILGEGEERPRLEARLRRLGLEDRSSLPGLVRDVHAELERAHLFAFPSRYEGFPNALGEALATGLPALAFRGVSGVEELVLEGHSGLLADRSGDPIRERAALVAALRALMGDSERREAMGAAARASIRRYRPEQIYAEWEDLLGSLLAEAESGARSRRAAPSPRGRSA
ncbi:MAG: glycosyltransferase, partial [Myxococcales bacterium]|nr:glycosyltransferase [Myxococcales bacterium]